MSASSSALVPWPRLAEGKSSSGIVAPAERGGVPSVSDVEVYDRPRTVGDTERGDELRAEMAALEQLVQAFDDNVVRATATGGHA